MAKFLFFSNYIPPIAYPVQKSTWVSLTSNPSPISKQYGSFACQIHQYVEHNNLFTFKISKSIVHLPHSLFFSNFWRFEQQYNMDESTVWPSNQVSFCCSEAFDIDALVSLECHKLCLWSTGNLFTLNISSMILFYYTIQWYQGGNKDTQTKRTCVDLHYIHMDHP